MCPPIADDAVVSSLLPIEKEETSAATDIQRIARGRQARHYVERRRVQYNKAATRIQVSSYTLS